MAHIIDNDITIDGNLTNTGIVNVLGDLQARGNVDIIGNMAMARYYLTVNKTFTSTPTIITSLTLSFIKGKVNGNASWLVESPDGTFKVTSTGYYKIHVNGRCHTTNTTAGQWFQIDINVNNVVISNTMESIGNSISPTYTSCVGTDIIPITDITHPINFKITQDGGGQGINLEGGSNRTWFLFERVGAL